MATRSALRRALHWQYSGVVLPLLLATAVGFMLGGRYVAAYVTYVVCGVWSIAWWITHDAVQSKREFLKRQIERKRLTRRARISFWKTVSYGVVPILATVLVGCIYTRRIEIEESLKEYHGLLYPDTLPDPYGTCKPDDGQLAIYAGNYSLVAESFPQGVVAIHSMPVVVLDRKTDGAIALSLTIRSSDERVIVEMENGEFTVNQNNVLRMFRPDRSQLIIKDQFGTEVLNAHYLNKSAIRLAAKFYQGGKVYDLSGVPLRGMCLERAVPQGTRVTGYMINFDPKPQ